MDKLHASPRLSYQIVDAWFDPEAFSADALEHTRRTTHNYFYIPLRENVRKLTSVQGRLPHSVQEEEELERVNFRRVYGRRNAFAIEGCVNVDETELIFIVDLD